MAYRPLFAIRPEPGASATVKAAALRGLEVQAYPLFGVESVAWDAPDAALYDGILLGSANALRKGGADLARYTHLPVYAVGAATAKAAETAGFRVEICGEGVLQGVVDRLAAASDEPRRFLRLTGEDHVPVELPPYLRVDSRAVYRCPQYSIGAEFADSLAQGALVLLHSAIAATHFAHEVDRLGLDRGTIALATFGPRITSAAGSGWAEARSAARPSDDALLSLVFEMCHDRCPSGSKASDKA